MFKLKKFCVCFICLVLVINLLIPLEVQAVTKNEAIDFFNDFSSATNESNISKIKKYFNNYSEDEFIEIFRIANVTYPKTSAYFFIARGCQEIGELENAYKYYSKAINSINSIKNANAEFKGCIFKNRAICNFQRIKNKYDEKICDEMIKDFEISLSYNPNDYDTYYNFGYIYCDYIGDKKIGLNFLNKAKTLCKNPKIKEEIQEEIDEYKPGIFSTVWDMVKKRRKELIKIGWELTKIYIQYKVASSNYDAQYYEEDY